MNARATVVGAAIVRDGRVLAARRTSPPEAAGRWEFPGGKVDPGETDGEALEREVREELGCTVEVAAWLAGEAPIGAAHLLRVAVVRLVEGEPSPSEHDAVRWLDHQEIGEVDWLEPDRPFLAELTRRLQHHGQARGIFFEQSDAQAVQARLTRAGYAATTLRERLAGEDDDEDHPWAVLTDAPAFVLELLVEEFDGWLDEDDPVNAPAQTTLPPLDLPAAPKRIKRP